MSNRAALYLRSSKDRSDVSIDAQRRALHELAQDRNLAVADEYADAVESGKDEDRPAFQRLIRDVRTGRFDVVLALDTSRIARRRHLALIFENECQKQRVRVVYRNVPDTDPITEMLLKSILQAMDEWHSLTSKAKGLAGMAENVRQGWRAGGRAPRGYQLEYHGTGAVRDGTPVLKSKLALDPDQAPTMQAYLRARARGEARGVTLARLGLDIPVATLIGIEWQALTYAGHTVWNVHNEMTTDGYAGGTKRRPRSEWLITENTHPALITPEEAERILAELERGQERRRRATDHTYLLAGILMTPDGRQWAGADGAAYRLGKGQRIASRRVDDAVLDQLLTDLQADETVDRIVAAMRRIVDAPVDGRSIAALEKRIAGLSAKVGRLVDLIADAPAPAVAAYQRQITEYELERARLAEEAAQLRAAREQARQAEAITPDQVRGMLRTVLGEMREAPAEQQRQAIAGLVERVDLDPETLSCTMHYRLETGVKLASRRGFEPTPVFTWSRNVVVLPAQRGRTAVRRAA